MFTMDERQLWSAVLAQAAKDASHGGMAGVPLTRKRAERSRLRRWLGSADFLEVCALAGVDVQETRQGLLKKLLDDVEGPGEDWIEARYAGLSAEVRDEIELTRLDRAGLIRRLATMDQQEAHAIVRRALDKGTPAIA